MTRGKESEKHKLIKEYGKMLLNDEFQIPKEYIYEEFTIGSIKYDLLVYPPLDIKDIKIFGIECGTKKSSKKKNYIHFKECLKHVDFVIWIPYDAFLAPFIDLLNAKIKNLLFIPCSFEFKHEKFRELLNYASEEKIAALLITSKERYTFPEKIKMMKEYFFED